MKMEPEEYTYTVFKTKLPTKQVYQVCKNTMGVMVDSYWVEIKEHTVFCNCPGFLRQKFDYEKHKHVLIVRDFIKRGEPADAEYRIHGTGAKAQIEVLK